MGEERTGTAHTHAPRACLRPQLATSRGATRQRLLYECANAHHLHSPAAFFRAPPPRRSLLRREAPSHSARAAEKFLGTCLAKRILRANWASGKRTSSTRTATNAGRQQRASRQAAATSSVLSSRKGTGCRKQGAVETLARNCTDAISGPGRLQIVSTAPDQRSSSSSWTR